MEAQHSHRFLAGLAAGVAVGLLVASVVFVWIDKQKMELSTKVDSLTTEVATLKKQAPKKLTEEEQIVQAARNFCALQVDKKGQPYELYIGAYETKQITPSDPIHYSSNKKSALLHSDCGPKDSSDKFRMGLPYVMKKVGNIWQVAYMTGQPGHDSDREALYGIDPSTFITY